MREQGQLNNARRKKKVFVGQECIPPEIPPDVMEKRIMDRQSQSVVLEVWSKYGRQGEVPGRHLAEVLCSKNLVRWK